MDYLPIHNSRDLTLYTSRRSTPVSETSTVDSPTGRPSVFPLSTITYKGIVVKAALPHISPEVLEAIVGSPKFKNWLDDFNRDEIDIQEFNVTDVDFFGPINPLKLGFVKGFGVAFDRKSGDPIPAIAFLRGSSVAVLIVVKVTETNKLYILLCRQLRFPAGRSLIEACAGMVDDNTKNIVGVVFKEILEETGFQINQSDLLSLGNIRPSGGGCDEVIHLYAWETEISQSEFNEKLENVYGEGTHEKIKLIFYEYDTFDLILDEIGDVKAECCWRRYLNSKHKNF